MVLSGTEIKSIRAGKVNIRDAYAKPDGKEMWLLNSHVAQYDKGNRYNHDPIRPRKLLLHKRQIRQLTSKVMEKGLTLVPLKLYIKDGVAKIELGIAKGKKLYDKRESISKRDSDRQMARTLRNLR